jgi:peptidoglycan hydrolase CwlO-like protein
MCNKRKTQKRRWITISFLNLYIIILYMNLKKIYEIIIITIISLLFIFLFFSNFFPIIEGIEISNAEKNMIYDQEASINIIQTQQKNLEDELSSIKNELKSSNKQMKKEKKEIDKIINVAKNKAKKIGI